MRNLATLTPLLSHARWCGLRTLAPPRGDPVSFRCDGMTLRGMLLAAPRPRRAATLLLAHGSSRHGRRLPMNQILAADFARRGYNVLTFDARGYGESDDPPAPIPGRLFDFPRDIVAALDLLENEVGVDPQLTSLLGHSFGAGVALEAQRRDPRIARLVLFGPPRRLQERFLDELAPDRELITARLAWDMRLPYRPNPAVMRRVMEMTDLERHLPRFTEPEHVPLLLIDAAVENRRDREFMARLYRQMSPPVSYWTVPASDHYLHTGRLAGRLIYHPPTVHRFVQRVHDWLQARSVAPTATASAAG